MMVVVFLIGGPEGTHIKYKGSDHQIRFLCIYVIASMILIVVVIKMSV